MGKLRFKLSHVIARSWFARLRRAYRLKPGVQSLVPFAVGSSSSIAANNMRCCSGRSSWSDGGGGNDDDSLALLKNHNKAEAEDTSGRDLAEFHKWIKEREREERLSLRQQLHEKKDKGKKKVYPLGSYNSWCRREAPQNVEESCQYSIPSRKKIEKKKKNKAGEEEEAWEREGCWSVIAQVGDAKIVRKKVVLKKRMNRGGAHQDAIAVGVVKGQRAPANSDNSEDDRKSALAAKSSTQQSESSSKSSFSSSSYSSSACSSSNNFRLSTSSSSGNASLLGADVLAWEKEQYSPFAASDKSSNTGAANDHALGAVSKGAFLFLDHDQTVESTSSCLFDEEENPDDVGLHQNKGLRCTKSPSRSSKHRRWESSNLEASMRAWDDNLGVITSALLRRHSNEDEEEDDVPSRRRLSFEKSSYAQNGHLEHEDYDGGGLGFRDGRAKVGESVAVSMFSSDPYEDFKQSMMQMIVEKRLFKAVELEELLERYLCLNSPGYHDLIVQVFSDLWLQVF